jgi:hypothetical protein
MKNVIIYQEIPSEAEGFPRVSIIIPYESKMDIQRTLTDMLKKAADKVEKELYTKYTEERLMPVMKKLRHFIAGIRCRKNKKSLCILVTPVTEKVYYFTPTKELLNQFPPSLN